MSATDDTIDFGFEQVRTEEKQGRVRQVFDSVARDYDRMNDAMSMGLHRVWKDMAITKLNPQPGERLLDVAGGTGDIARRFIQAAETVRDRRGGQGLPDKGPASAVILDINDEMLLAGIDPNKDAGLDLTRVCANAQDLPFEDAQFDAVTIAYGIRNVTDRMAALREFHRVLKPGGRLGVLEFSTPPETLIRKFYDAYSFTVIPRLGQAIAGDRDSYQYLVESIRRFPKQDQFAQMMRDAGFAQVKWADYSAGVTAFHTGWKIA
ncbi:ubiquinone/menaquinone biosynthesis C-methyltransferase UbiE [Algimonas ampicilliniresistens]|uniref:Ubiquinone/menaquinone biosynthesis C-methyltransferase UbiE n=1 Tax=Algimonas ampicilliniresistens TaxID=1298735 RepID=A0ABQ5V9E6_9PROT|nr:bifunctional demethylmenaquinone methyltransferase/2-methoxy-6-polyprenyl-1,4-benzoquinol methylase UbiE [Algimonas ampicilliniresistens]GLQ24139.1 ubiquinone/menaquinone biosynthesis C-methyltransferase UbiE [Algimonas ampicilliniresistens]